MNIIVSGKHLEVGEALRSHAAAMLQRHVKKYFNNAVDANIMLSKQADFFHTHVTVNDGTGTHFLVNGDGDDADAYRSVDKAVRKIEIQLERYKTRIKNHRKLNFSKVPIDARKYVINDFPQEESAIDDVTSEEVGPTIIAEKQISVPILSVRDAVMYMNLQNIPAILFINSINNKLNMVYNRSDSNVAWVDTSIDFTENINQ